MVAIELLATPFASDDADVARALIFELRSPSDEIWTVMAACRAVFFVIGCASRATSLSTMLLVSRPDARPPAVKMGVVVDMKESPLGDRLGRCVSKNLGRGPPREGGPLPGCFLEGRRPAVSIPAAGR